MELLECNICIWWIQIATVTNTELEKAFATKVLENVCVGKATAATVVTNACRASTAIPNVNTATVAVSEVQQPFAILLESVPVFTTSPAELATSAVQATTSFLSACVSFLRCSVSVLFNNQHHSHVFTACECHDEGSQGVSCDDEGNCHCKPNFDGMHCDQCKAGFYIFPQCEGK